MAGRRRGAAVPTVMASSDPLADLPPPETQRWVVRRKAQVVAAVREGRLTVDEACARYRLSGEEFLIWSRKFERHGAPGLRVTRVQVYRD
ncbi:MAG: DUF1153 domain-containing protein [Pseudomonadota bacterium]